MQYDLAHILNQSPVIPVLTIEHLDDAVPLAKALYDGGLSVLEVTLRTVVALEAIKVLRKTFPALIIGAGTVLTAQQYQQAVEAGSQFIVSPGVTIDLLEQACIYDVPFLPAATTLSEMMELYRRGYSTLKFFPAELNGGVDCLKTVATVLPKLTFCPTGGINSVNAPHYLALPTIACVGGSWMASQEMINKKNWDMMTQISHHASQLGKPTA